MNEHGKSLTKMFAYNAEPPKWDFLFMGVAHMPGHEILAHRVLPLRHPDLLLGWEDDFYEESILEMLPEKGVYNVVALGKMWGEKYWTEYGYEYEGGIRWTMIAANKFWRFGDLKRWYKNWRRSNPN